MAYSKKSGAKGKGLQKTNAMEEVIITQQTNTQSLDDEAVRLLKRDVEEAKSRDSILVVIRGNAQGKRHVLDADEVTLGRSRRANIRIFDPSISGMHCAFTKKGNEVFAEDLNSNNGTYLNNEKFEGKVKLSKEDMLTVGTTVLKFVPAGELEILYHGNLLKAAYSDQLTGVYNRNYLEEALEAEFKRAKVLDQPLSIIMCDIDKFKEINDTFGHPAGDFALREFARMLVSDLLRPNEIVGRYGGDEFIIMLWNTVPQMAQLLGEKVQVAVEKHTLTYEGKELPFTVSIGIAGGHSEFKGVQDLIKAADAALYESKEKGRNRVSISKKQ